MLSIKRNGTDAAKRLVFDVSDPGIDLEIIEKVEDFERRSGIDCELDVGVLLSIGRRERSHHRKRGGNCSEPQSPGQAVPQRVDLLAHCAAVADNASRPFEDPLAFRRESLKA